MRKMFLPLRMRQSRLYPGKRHSCKTFGTQIELILQNRCLKNPIRNRGNYRSANLIFSIKFITKREKPLVTLHFTSDTHFQRQLTIFSSSPVSLPFTFKYCACIFLFLIFSIRYYQLSSCSRRWFDSLPTPLPLYSISQQWRFKYIHCLPHCE